MHFVKSIFYSFLLNGLVAWCSGNAFDPINEVTVRRARLVLRWVTHRDCLRAGKLSRYVSSRLGQLSLPSLRGK